MGFWVAASTIAFVANLPMCRAKHTIVFLCNVMAVHRCACVHLIAGRLSYDKLRSSGIEPKRILFVVTTNNALVVSIHNLDISHSLERYMKNRYQGIYKYI